MRLCSEVHTWEPRLMPTASLIPGANVLWSLRYRILLSPLAWAGAPIASAAGIINAVADHRAMFIGRP